MRVQQSGIRWKAVAMWALAMVLLCLAGLVAVVALRLGMVGWLDPAARGYARICPMQSGGACLRIEPWHLLVLFAGFLGGGVLSMVKGVKCWRSIGTSCRRSGTDRHP